MRRKLLTFLVALGTCALAASCGSGDSPGSAEGGGGDAEAPVEASGISMVDVASGATTTLAEALEPSDGKPLLAWFWAPFCPTCRGEAPVLDEFMADNADRVSLVGIGTRDDLEYAEEFLATTGVQNFPLLWEGTGRSWVDNAVAAQPYMILFDASGEEVQRWPGGASVTQIENALAELS